MRHILTDEEKSKTKFSSTNQPKHNGRKKKIKGMIDQSVKEDGLLLSNEQILEIYRACISLTEEELKRRINNKQTKMIERIIAREVLGKKGFDTIERIVNRISGMPRQQTDVTSLGKQIQAPPTVFRLVRTKEELEKLRKEQEENEQ